MEQYRLFKYRLIRGESRDYTRRLIRDARIYYAAPGQLNDPFDCDICVTVDGEAVAAHGLRAERAGEVKAFTEKWLRDVGNKILGVLSLCRVNDDVQMWSHYADGHAGVCLEFYFEATEPLHEVRYSNERPGFHFADFDELTRDPARFPKSVIDVLTTKAVQWAHEQELRCIDFCGPGEQPMPANMLVGVIFGCRTSDGDKAMVRDWVASSGQRPHFYQARQRDGSFALEIERLDR